MELIYAALLLHEAGQDVNEENVQGLLDGAGVEVDDSQVKALVAALEDVDIEEAMENTVAAPAPAADGAADGGAQDAADEAAEEAAEEEEEAAPEDEGASEEEAAEGLGSLF